MVCLLIYWPRWWYMAAKKFANICSGMSWCSLAASHYLNQCWPVIKEIFWHLTRSIFQWNTQDNHLLKCIWRLQWHIFINYSHISQGSMSSLKCNLVCYKPSSVYTIQTARTGNTLFIGAYVYDPTSHTSTGTIMSWPNSPRRPHQWPLLLTWINLNPSMD